jgi:TPP-dependent pyruvate/acetoin dehydrogenase alpha subunit
VFLCENNAYGEYTPFEAVTAGTIRGRAEAMEVASEAVDGMSVASVREAALRATGHARSGEGPYFVEAITYRFVGHSRSDPGAYRPEGELERWRARDPLVLLRARLEDSAVEPATLDGLEASVAAELVQLEERGLAAPFPEPRSTGERSE